MAAAGEPPTRRNGEKWNGQGVLDRARSMSTTMRPIRIYVASNGEAFCEIWRTLSSSVAGVSSGFGRIQPLAQCGHRVPLLRGRARLLGIPPEYQAARARQEGGAEMDAIVIEGYEGPQPGDG